MNTKDTIDVLKYHFNIKMGLFKSVVGLLQCGKKIEEELIQFLEKENPYPEDVFLPVEKEDFNKINNLLKKEMGYSIDRLSGNMGRKIYKSIIEILREMIK